MGFAINRTKKMCKHRIVSAAISNQQYVWTINFNGLFLDSSALCKCRLIALHNPFNVCKGWVNLTEEEYSLVFRILRLKEIDLDIPWVPEP